MRIIKTKDFVLRPLRIRDVDVYWESMQDEATKVGFMTTPKNLAEAKKEVEKRISRNKQRNIVEEILVIEVNSEYAGYISLHSLDNKPLTKKGTIGIVGVCVHPKFRGRGLASKSLKVFTDYAFKKYPIIRISGRCRSFNKASAGAMKKAGFKFEGEHKKEIYKNGKYYDNLYFARVR